jgi:hypothetical protein
MVQGIMGAEEVHRGLIAYETDSPEDVEAGMSAAMQDIPLEPGDEGGAWWWVEMALLVLVATALHGAYRGREPRRRMRGIGLTFVAAVTYAAGCCLDFEDDYVGLAAALLVGGITAVGAADAWWSDGAMSPSPQVAAHLPAGEPVAEQTPSWSAVPPGAFDAERAEGEPDAWSALLQK